MRYVVLSAYCFRCHEHVRQAVRDGDVATASLLRCPGCQGELVWRAVGRSLVGHEPRFLTVRYRFTLGTKG